ncbi:calpain family cysteine protease [Diplogelasinospora grovesii]|uniref:Calpain family cysteine protease n=1 Tax=Diplogelasinospora grovesii TaxID=303347 RepID=A0AAN6NL14_9PEZI|nr:calpain family cysteine protease [Diplogelasinospora grovesii]
MAEMPVVIPHHHASKQKAPQQKLDGFWHKFTTTAPGKATRVLPQNEYADRAAKRSSNSTKGGVGGGQTAQASYEEAAVLCKAKVDKIIAECRRVNQKYRDVHFDLEFDLKSNRRYCLESLCNRRDEISIAYSSGSGSDGPGPGPPRPRPRSHHRRERIRIDSQMARDWAGEGNGPDAPSSPQGRAPGSMFCPRAVKRVTEIFDDPTFYIDGPTANDVRQGRDGDCWLMAALCNISNKKGLIEKICVRHDKNVGVYGFVFHRDGEWFSEIIDDKLYLTKPDYDERAATSERILWEDRDRPDSEEIYRKTFQSNSGALYFAQCENPNETWLPLLEKAYAKAHGDYAALEGGNTGEGIEDLTGGVTSPLLTTDILDTEYFWKEELLKVNQQFLFGCSTGLWGGFGERKGIMEQHAYSVMKAVEKDGERLLLLKNPWGKGEWTGPWSDGSKEWTAEWMKKLDHKFGDDGAFWISYKDLLRKYQAFDRTRLFGPDWKVTSIWTTLSVPWTHKYHDTKFSFTLARPGPVVLVLSQLDDRYFRGLEGQYKFGLSFRVHKAGEDEYIVRTQSTYRMTRSVNVELNLEEAGEYTVLVKIDARRDWTIMPVEEVVRENALVNREKLMRVGLSYDLAHSKAVKIVETAEEKAARKAHEKRKLEKEKKKLRKAIMEDKQTDYYWKCKEEEKRWKKAQRQKKRQKAKEQQKRLKAEAKAKAREEKKATEKEKQRQIEASKVDAGIQAPEPMQPEVHQGEARGKDIKDAASPTTDAGENTPTSTSASGQDAAGKEIAGNSADTAAPTTPAKEPTSDKLGVTEQLRKEETSKHTSTGKDGSRQKQTDAAGHTLETDMAYHRKRALELISNFKADVDSLFADIVSQEPEPEHRPPAFDSHEQRGRNPYEHSDDRHMHPPASRSRSGLRSRTPTPPPPPQPHIRFDGSRHRPPPPGYRSGPPSTHGFRGAGRPGSFRGPQQSGSEGGDESDFDTTDRDDLRSITSVSDVTDRELEMRVQENRPGGGSNMLPPPRPRNDYRRDRGGRSDDDEDDRMLERDPWNAVAVVGLRVYYKLHEEAGKDNSEIVKLKVVRPNPWVLSEEDEDDKKEKKTHKLKDGEKEEDTEKGEGEETDEAKVLDVDDSAKDATLDENDKKEVIEASEASSQV